MYNERTGVSGLSSEVKLRNLAELQAHLAAGGSLAGADLQGAVLAGAEIEGQDLAGAKLRYADLSGANLRGSLFRNANMRHVKLTGADLRFADLSGADLSESDLHGVLIGETRLDGIQIEGCTGIAKKVFFPVQQLQALVGRPGVQLGEDSIRIEAASAELFRIDPAVRVIERDDGSAPDEWVGKVLTEARIRELGGEYDSGYLLIGNRSWRVEEGYLGDPQPLEAGAPVAGLAATKMPEPVEPAEPAAAGSATDRRSDMSLLEDFLLNKLN